MAPSTAIYESNDRYKSTADNINYKVPSNCVNVTLSNWNTSEGIIDPNKTLNSKESTIEVS